MIRLFVIFTGVNYFCSANFLKQIYVNQDTFKMFVHVCSTAKYYLKHQMKKLKRVPVVSLVQLPILAYNEAYSSNLINRLLKIEKDDTSTLL